MNASCASGIFLGACVYQCLLTHPSPPLLGGSTALASGRWSLGVAGVVVLSSNDDDDDTGIPRRVDLRTKRAVWCLNLSRQVWTVRRGCGKSVTRHHRQRDAPLLFVNQPRSDSAGPRAWRWGTPPAPPHRSAVVGSTSSDADPPHDTFPWT